MPTPDSSDWGDDGFGEVSYSGNAQGNGAAPAVATPPADDWGQPRYSHHSNEFSQRSESDGRSESGQRGEGQRDRLAQSTLPERVAVASPAQRATQAPLTPSYPQTTQPNVKRDSEPRRRRIHERGLPGFAGLAILLVVCLAGGLIDVMSGSTVKGGFNIALVAGSLLAIIAVRRSSLFPIVVAPPIIYLVASAAMLYIRSNGLKNRSVILDAGINWLVYGFPAIAGATAAVLIVAGVRLAINK